MPRPDRLIASDLARTRASAAIIGRHWGQTVTLDPRLREMHFGEWEGRAWSDIERRDAARLAAWMADWVRVRVPGGESFEDVATRAQAWFGELTSAAHATGAASPDETIVVVAHAGTIRALCCIWLALPLDHAFRFRIEPAGASLLALGLPPRSATGERAPLPPPHSPQAV